MRIKKVSGTAVLQGNIVDSLNSNSSLNAPSIRAVNEGLGNIKGKILWTNPNPTSEISSNTNITLNSNDYDMGIYLYRVSTNNNLMTSTIFSKGYGIYLPLSLKETSGYRNITRNSDTSYMINIAEGTTNNTIIPLYIIGYKTGLFN